MFSPHFSSQHRRRPQLHASTPAAINSSHGDGPSTRHQSVPPNRLTYMNLYGNQRIREPAYNFMASGSSSEAAVATSGDLPIR